MLQGPRNGPAPFGRPPGLRSEPATGLLFAHGVPQGNPSAPSAVGPWLDKVAGAIPRVRPAPWRRVSSVAGALDVHDASWRQALHTRGMLTLGMPKTREPIPIHPSPEAVRAILTEAGVHRQRTP
jgi:hypothetical protein